MSTSDGWRGDHILSEVSIALRRTEQTLSQRGTIWAESVLYGLITELHEIIDRYAVAERPRPVVDGTPQGEDVRGLIADGVERT